MNPQLCRDEFVMNSKSKWLNEDPMSIMLSLSKKQLCEKWIKMKSGKSEEENQ